jgi:putative tryptophan/tyrosine transport system substrate-binding protein
MKRRAFIAGLGAVTAAWPMAARAQRARVPLIGYLGAASAASEQPFAEAFRAGLNESGYVEGQNVTIEYRWAYDQVERLPALAADLVRFKVDVIVASGTPTALAAKAATTMIPIVFQIGTDPVALKLVGSMNRPGGSITGVTNITVSLAAKRLGLLRELVPNAEKIAILSNPSSPGNDAQTMDVQEAARALGVNLIVLNAASEGDIDAIFATLGQQRVSALLPADNTFFNSRRDQLVALAAHYNIPTLYTFREFALAGGLMSYASSLRDTYRQAGIYVARILKGEKPADLPVLQPTKFEFVINLKTAKALGLDIPPGILALADEVIE